MRLRFVLLGLTALAALSLVFLSGPIQDSLGLGSTGVLPPLGVIAFAPPAITPDSAAIYDALSITYKDPRLGFSLRYPVGYAAQSEDGEVFAFYAPTPEGFSESFVVTPTNETYSSSELVSTVLSDFENATLVSSRLVAVDGKAVPRNEYLITAGAESLRAVQSLMSCSGISSPAFSGSATSSASGSSASPSVSSSVSVSTASSSAVPYSIYYLAVIPDSTRDDIALADYVLNSLRC